MYCARKELFIDRLGWDLTVDGEGRETDPFDKLSPVYLLDADDRNRHRGSVRLLPTTGATVLGDRIAELMDGMPISTPAVWEFSRFCVIGRETARLSAPEIRQVAVNLMLAICETCMARGVDHVVGSFDQRMGRLFDQNGWTPETLGKGGRGRNAVYLGIWETTRESAAALRASGGLSGSIVTVPGP